MEKSKVYLNARKRAGSYALNFHQRITNTFNGRDTEKIALYPNIAKANGAPA